MKETCTRRILPQARAALQEIADAVGWLTYRGPNRMRFALGGYSYYKEWRGLEEWEEKYKSIKYLKRQKLLKEKRIGERLMVKLTEKGYGLALRDKIISTKAVCPRGQCLVVFDIPEIRRRDRDYFRRFLKESGFKRLQHSIWFSDKDISIPLTEFVRNNELTPWIQIIEGHVLSEPK